MRPLELLFASVVAIFLQLQVVEFHHDLVEVFSNREAGEFTLMLVATRSLFFVSVEGIISYMTTFNTIIKERFYVWDIFYSGIISNAQFYTPFLFKWFLNSEIKELGFDPGLLFYSYQYEVAKPSPALFNMAAEKLYSKGIQPGSVLFVGNDMLNDIYPAHAIGFQTALFAGDRRSLRLRADDSRCADLKPDLVLTDLEQLIQYI